MDNVTDQNEEKFDAYILGTMPEGERAAFAARLLEDAALNAKFIEHERAVAGIRKDAREELREDLEAIHQKKPRILKETKVLKLRPILSWAAAAILLLIGVFYFMPSSTSSSDELLAEYYAPYTLKVGLRNNGGQEDLLQIDDLYAKGEYTAAIPLLNQYLRDHPAENTLRLALAISLFETKKTDAAMNELNVIEQSADAFLQDQVSWYKALMLIEQDKMVQAKSLLAPLANNREADHHESAVELLSKIN